MSGTSAYCGILRLAAYQVAVQIAEILEKREEARALRIIFKKAKDALYQKLWNGKYFNFDQKSNDIMAAQLMGQWYLDQLHLPAAIPEQDILSVFNYIYEFNFKKFLKGTVGVVNGRTFPEANDVTASQGNDVWTGINFALAAHMYQRGRKKQALKILKAVTKTINTRGFLFRTPESWDGKDGFIASMYMRPGAIWAMADLF
jgi:non-lysosomal glucosylceramidase